MPPTGKPKPASPPADEPSFEDSLQGLESIIARIESGEVGLETSLVEYERGVELIRRCRSILKNAEQRVEELSGRMLGGAPDGSSMRPTEDQPEPGS